MKNISSAKAAKLIKASRQREFSCLFLKRDGSFREMRCKYGYRDESLTGEGLKYDPKDFDLIIVWDVESAGYRSFHIGRLLELKLDGEEYTITNE